MNWKEFKLQAESAGVTDSMEIWYIDIDCWSDTSELDVDIRDQNGGVIIT